MEKLRKRAGSQGGFTLVELLVVILILGILAAIAIPAFLSQRQKAQDADAKASARTAATAMETYATENNGEYTGAAVGDANTPGSLVFIEPTLAGADLTLPTAATSNSYAVRVTSSETQNWFQIERNADGTNTYTCQTQGDGGCPSGGRWSGN